MSSSKPVCRFEDQTSTSNEALHSHEHYHTHDHDNDHGHTHEKLDSPGNYIQREMPIYAKRNWQERAFTVGIGG